VGDRREGSNRVGRRIGKPTVSRPPRSLAASDFSWMRRASRFVSLVFERMPNSAGAVSFIAAATSTWLLNRRWTSGPPGSWPESNEYVRYVSVKGIGLVVNSPVYAFCIQTSPVVALQPVFALAGGSLAGLLFNYFGSRPFVFV
jgi:putative flippase GtrA